MKYYNGWYQWPSTYNGFGPQNTSITSSLSNGSNNCNSTQFVSLNQHVNTLKCVKFHSFVRISKHDLYNKMSSKHPVPSTQYLSFTIFFDLHSNKAGGSKGHRATSNSVANRNSSHCLTNKLFRF